MRPRHLDTLIRVSVFDKIAKVGDSGPEAIQFVIGYQHILRLQIAMYKIHTRISYVVALQATQRDLLPLCIHVTAIAISRYKLQRYPIFQVRLKSIRWPQELIGVTRAGHTWFVPATS